MNESPVTFAIRHGLIRSFIQPDPREAIIRKWVEFVQGTQK